MESYTLEEKVLRKVMRNIPMGLIVSKEGFRRKIYYVNDTACEIMGYTREEYIRKMQDGWTDLMDVDLREVIREHNEQIRSGTPFEVLSRPQTKNGGYKWILSRVNVQMQEGPLCYVSFMLPTGWSGRNCAGRRTRCSGSRRCRTPLRSF